MFYRKYLSLLSVLAIAFIDWMGIGLVYPMFSSMLFHQEFAILPIDASSATRGFYLGILLATMPLTQFFSSPLLGGMSDQRGRKKILVWSLLLGVLGYAVGFLGVVIKNLPILFLSRIIVGISAGNAAVVAACIADVSGEQEKAKHYGWLNMACGLGFTMGPFLGGYLSTLNGSSHYEIPFLFAGMATLLNFLFVCCYFRETHTSSNQNKMSMLMGIKNLRKAFRLKQLRILFLCVFVFVFGWSFFYEFIPVTWIENYGLNAKGIGNFYAYGAAFYALSCGLLIQPIVNRFRALNILFYALIGQGLYILLLLIEIPLWGLWIYLPLLQFLIALIFPTSTAVVSNAVEDKAQGEILGIYQSIISMALAMSPFTSGALLGIHSEMPIFVGGGCMLIAAFVIGSLLKRNTAK